jgi:hypothetical protein
MYYIQIAAGTLQALEEVGITSASLLLKANGVDSFDFAADSALTAAGIAFGTEIKIYDVALCIFVGEVVSIPSDESAASPGQKRYQALSYLNQLDRTQYTQDINAYSTADSEVQSFIDPRVVLGVTYPGTRITNTAQVAAVLDFAISVKSIPISRDATWPTGFLCPIDQKEDISCWDAIVSQLRWLPDHVLRCSYATGSTVVKLVKASDVTPTSIAVTGTLSAIAATPRHDLVMVGVNVYFRKVTTVDGVAMESRTVQSAGDGMDPFATNLYVDLDGGSAEFVRQAITVAGYPVFAAPASVGLEAWLEAKVPWLADIEDYTVTAIARTGTHAYAKELMKGTIAKWMSVGSEEETITATIEYDIKDGTTYIERATMKVPIQVTSCNGVTKTYSKISASDSGELEPAGLAAGLYASWSKLHWDGVLSSYLTKTGYLLPGALLNITGAHASLSTMAAVIQSVSIDLATTAITIDYGTCRALEADSYTALYRAIRYRRSSSRILADADDKEAAENDETSIESLPTGKATPSPAIKRKETSVTDTGKGVATISAADLASGELGKFREFTFAVDPATGTARKLKVFATEGSEEEIDIPAGGADWDGTAPSGYEWETLNIVTDGKIVARKILTKTADKADVSTWTSSDSRLLLQCNTSGVLRLDKGYLKS